MSDRDKLADGSRSPPKSPAVTLRSIKTLQKAWTKVRSTGLSSGSFQTRSEIVQFEANLFSNLHRIIRQLRDQTYIFDPQLGVLIQPKKKKKKPRPIVIAPVKNRIVQRAILDVLQANHAVAQLLETPTSFGGIENRGREKAIEAVRNAIQGGALVYLKSDIREFFTKIPKPLAKNTIKQIFDDEEFCSLFNAATDTELSNLADLAADSTYFPLEDQGVAQGCCLSPLIGNILLHDFDTKLNGRGIVCLRYIDDFIILGKNVSNVRKAFKQGSRILNSLGLAAYDPADGSGKAAVGTVSDGFEFLGVHVRPATIQPSAAARQRLLDKVMMATRRGKKTLRMVKKNGEGSKFRFVQTLMEVDGILKGWGHSYRFCNSKEITTLLDEQIDEILENFFRFYRAITRDEKRPAKRRMLGVQLLQDIKKTKPGRLTEASSWPSSVA